MIKLKTAPMILASAAAMLSLGGCASPARVQNMIANSVGVVSTNNTLYGSISVTNVTGGQPTDPMQHPQISNEAFRKALQASLGNAGLLAQNAGEYRMEADILTVSQPVMGFNFDIYMQVRYLVIDTSDRVVYRHTSESHGKATMSEAFGGVTRLRIANERAAQANIKSMLDDLLMLSLTQATHR